MRGVNQMDSPKGRTIANKWLKTAVLLQDPIVARYIPDTHPFTTEMFSTFLSKYKKVVLKPIIGTGGHGLLLVHNEGAQQYSIQYYSKIYRYHSFKKTINRIQKIMAGRSYLMQPCVRLTKIDGRPIDYRVKIVKMENEWKITAMVGRLASKGLFVTNLCRGGTQLSFKQGIQKSLSKSSVKPLKSEMRSVTLKSTQLLERRFPGIKQLGFDFGIDKKGHIWFFEVNTDPH
jgi:glutathione synthase/RimK-type ligase-like ATP-grasp enzyme